MCSSHVHLILMFAYMCLEAWLGRTSRVKAGSVMGVLAMIVVALVQWAITSKERKSP